MTHQSHGLQAPISLRYRLAFASRSRSRLHRSEVHPRLHGGEPSGRRAQGFVQPRLRPTDPGEKDHGGKLHKSGPNTEAVVLLQPIRLGR